MIRRNFSLGAKKSIVLSTCLLFGLSIAVVSLGIVPPFTKDTSRAVNVCFCYYLAHKAVFLCDTHDVNEKV